MSETAGHGHGGHDHHAGGSATAGADYTGLPVTVTFADGQTTANFAITINDDAVFEGNESIILALTSPTGGVTQGTSLTIAQFVSLALFTTGLAFYLSLKYWSPGRQPIDGALRKVRLPESTDRDQQ